MVSPQIYALICWIRRDTHFKWFTHFCAQHFTTHNFFPLLLKSLPGRLVSFPCLNQNLTTGPGSWVSKINGRTSQNEKESQRELLSFTRILLECWIVCDVSEPEMTKSNPVWSPAGPIRPTRVSADDALQGHLNYVMTVFAAAENAVDCRKNLSVSILPPPLVSGRTSGIALQQHSSQKISFLFVSLKKVLSWFYSCFCSRSQILLVHMCFGIRISSPFHLATQTMPIQNLNCSKHAKTHAWTIDMMFN